MPTNRKVIDFKIHNLTEEQFQELKEAGQIDPNAIYCTPDETVANFEELNERIDTANERIDTANERIDTANKQINTKQDVATAVNYSHVTNCITEIPQDIKLELNNGVLTLKAGSKVYAPNGFESDGVTPKFDEITIESDVTAITTFYDNTVPSVLYYDFDDNRLYNSPTNAVASGSTQPSTSFTSYLWYDTANNTIKRYTVNTWIHTKSLPIAICSHDSSVWTGIDQVFNGFGYIGSTVFALPGVKGLIPNGRNADGSLNNIEVTTSAVQTMTMASYMAGRANAPLALWADKKLGGMEIDQRYWGTVKKLSDIVRPSYYACYYCLEDNLVHYFDGSGVESIRQQAFIGSFNVGSDNKITQFTSKPAFHAVDYNDLTDTSKNTINIAAPAGIVAAFAGSTPPAGWLRCDGSAVSRTTYAKLFAAIGGNYGTGDGSTTFNLPDLNGRIPFGMFGEYIGKSTNGVMPNITGQIDHILFDTFNLQVTNGAFLYSSLSSGGNDGGGYVRPSGSINFNAARSNSMYGNGWFSGERVVPASVGMNYCIKY